MKIKAALFLVPTAVIVGLTWLNYEDQPDNEVHVKNIIDHSLIDDALLELKNETRVESVPVLEMVDDSFEREEVTFEDLEKLYGEDPVADESESPVNVSEYTGDDTEDNDAGNEGFEDDFPDAAFAYDDHSAEGYVNYTESYADDY